MSRWVDMPTTADPDGPPLRERILRVFESVPAPSVDEIVPHDCEECRALRDDLVGLVPAEIPGKVLERHYADLPLLGPEALNYFLPGWLLFSLDHPNSEVFEYAIYHLTPSPSDAVDEYWRSRLDLFSADQRRAVADFLAWAESVASQEFLEGDFSRGAKVWA